MIAQYPLSKAVSLWLDNTFFTIVCKGHSANRMFEFRRSFLLLDNARSFKRERDMAV